MKKICFIAIPLAAALSVFTVGAAAQNTPAQPKSGMMDMSMMMNCPMSVPGATVEVSDSVDGIQVTFSTQSGDVAELRRRVESMAKMHGDSNGSMMARQTIPFSVKYEEIANGARVTLTPKDPAQLSQLRIQVRDHVKPMQKGDCSMMQNMMKGTMNGMMGNMKKSGSAPEEQAKPVEPDHSIHH